MPPEDLPQPSLMDIYRQQTGGAPSPEGGGGPAPPPPPSQPPAAQPPAAPPQPSPMPEVAPPAPPPAAVTPPAAQPPAPSTAMIQAMASRGHDWASAFDSDDQLLQTFEAMAAERQDVQRDAALIARGRAALAAESNQPAQPAPAAAPPPEETPAYPFDWAPEPAGYDPRFEQMVEQDPQTGMLRVRQDMPYVDPGIATKVQQYQDWQRGRLNQIITDFPSMVEQLVEQQVQQRLQTAEEQFNKQIDERFSQRDNETAATQFAEANRSRFFELDESGNVKVNPMTQEPMMTALGQQAWQLQQQAMNYGITDEAMLRQYIEDNLPAEDTTRTNGTPPPAQPAGVLSHQQPGFEQPPARSQGALNEAIRRDEILRAQSAPNSGHVAEVADAERLAKEDMGEASQFENLSLKQIVEREVSAGNLTLDN